MLIFSYMNATAIVGNNLSEVSKAVISQIEISSSLELENFVVVPDRFSLLAEKLVFEQLGISSTFNIKVLGISRLASIFFQEEKILSQNESRLKIFQILKENDFEFFKPNFDLATELFNIISQIKSSKVSLLELEKSCKTQKQKEIARVFSIYEATKNFPDQSDLISNLSSNLKKEKLENLSFFFVGFDSLTSQGELLLEKLILFSKRIVVGTTLPSSQKNSQVYDSDIFNKLNSISRRNKIKIEKIYLTEKENSLSRHILENLFSFSPKVIETTKVHLLEFETPENEIREIAKTILFYVKNKNKRFSSLNVLSGSLETTAKIFERVFEEYGISYFLDTSQKISNLPIHTFFFTLFSYLQTKSEECFFNLILNPYCDVPQNQISDFKNIILLNGQFCEELANNFENIKEIIEKINYFNKKIEKINNFSGFSNLINEIVLEFNLKERNEQLINHFSNVNLKSEKIYVQIFKKLENVLNELDSTAEVDFETYSTLFLSIFGEKEISAVPISTDCVFVGSEKSFFESRDVMFVSGATSGTIPLVSKDLGLFSDSDIEQINLGIEPTIQMINKRNKQKLLFDLCPKEELFVSTSGSALGEKLEKSVIFSELQKIFTFENSPLKIFNNFFAQFLPSKEFSLFEIQSGRDFEQKILKLKQQKKISDEKFNLILGSRKNQEEKISCAEELYKNFSPTGIERFFSCPFKHFFTHGLKLKENPKNVFNARDDGNYFHIAAQNFVSRNLEKIGNLSEREIQDELEKIDLIIKNQPRFALLSKNIKNKHIFEILKKETKMLFESINFERKFSNFVAKFMEQSFELDLGKKKLFGIVDRVDFFDNYFRVVDYKSGEVPKSLRAIYNGVELQLFIYLIAMQNKFGKDPCAGVYLPIGGDFSKNKKKFRFEGFILGEQGILKAFDRQLGDKKESNIVSIKLAAKSSPANLVLSTSKNVFSGEGFEAVIEYVKLLLLSAEREILSGKIPAIPIEGFICKNCQFFGICSFKQDEREEQRENGKQLSQTDFISICERQKPN